MASTRPERAFSYPESIHSEQIRLLEWPFRWRQQRKDRIYLSLRTYKRSKAPKYTALSYEWTQKPATVEIYIDEQALLVRPNLYGCLQQLSKRRHLCEHFWVDAICIDQSNTAERNEQVLEMARTYGNASLVVAWLGSDTRLDPEHWKPLSHFNASERECLMRAMGERDDTRKRSLHADDCSRKILRRFVFRPLNNVSQLCFGHPVKFLQLSYWMRRWVIQELQVAKRLLFLWGDFSFDEYNITSMLKRHVVSMQDEWALDLANPISWPGAIFFDLASPSALFTQGSKARPLHELLAEYHQSLNADPRDRIFALLGILPRRDHDILRAFFPDYSMNYCLIALLVCSYLEQTTWFGSAIYDLTHGEQDRGAEQSRSSYTASHAQVLGLRPEEMMRFLDISDLFERAERPFTTVQKEDIEAYVQLSAFDRPYAS